MINIEYLDEENNGLGCLTTLTTHKRRGQDKHKYHRCPIPLNITLCYIFDIDTNGYERRELCLTNRVSKRGNLSPL